MVSKVWWVVGRTWTRGQRVQGQCRHWRFNDVAKAAAKEACRLAVPRARCRVLVQVRIMM